MERKRILIAVNNAGDIDALRQAMHSSGFEVKIANDGMTALALGREFKPHLILSELNLPKIDGHHLLRELKSNNVTKTIPFVLMSKHRSVDERVHSIDLGVDDYITVPFDIREVMLRFDNLLGEVDIYETLPKKNSKGFNGKLSDMSLIDLIETLEVGGKSAVISVQNEESEGVVYVKNGQVVDAGLNELPPNKALFRMFTWNSGAFRVELRDIERQSTKFKESTQNLLFRGMSYREDWNLLCKHLPPLQSYIRINTTTASGNLTNDEKSILAGTENNNAQQKQMVDLIDHTDMDELKALKLVVQLFKKGIIEDIAVENIANGSPEQPRQNGHSPKELSEFVVHFLSTNPGVPYKRAHERRHGDRRALSDRRSRPRRWSDVVADKNSIYLNKSELVMIREKLSNGRK